MGRFYGQSEKISSSFMAKSLVDKPDNVEVDEIPGQQTILLALKVDKDDLGKVIGKQGKTAAAMRTIIRAAGTKTESTFITSISSNKF